MRTAIPTPSRPVLVAVASALLLLLAAAGCGADEEAVAPPPVLAADAVPYLPSSYRPLSAERVAREAGLPGFDERLSDWGFEAGASRYFQGQSRRLQVVDARTLRFSSPAGATAFMSFMRAHRDDFFAGSGPPRDFSSRGRRGLFLAGQPCSCHRASPSFAAVVARGPQVTWLQVNGPAASARSLEALMAEAP